MRSQQDSEELDQLLWRLVMETRQGHTTSYKKLLEALAPLVRRRADSLLARCGQRVMTEDVTQEVLLAVHLKLHTYDDDLSFMAWIQAVTRHKVIDALRRNKIAIASIDEPGFIEPSVLEETEREGARYDLRKLLAQLKPPAGEIIYALKVEGVTVRELASRHKTTESNIKVLVHRGLQKLSAMMANEKTS